MSGCQKLLHKTPFHHEGREEHEGMKGNAGVHQSLSLPALSFFVVVREFQRFT